MNLTVSCSREPKLQLANAKGMTLIEVMIASALMVTLLLTTFSFTTDLMKQVEGERDKTTFIIDANTGLQRLWPIIGAIKPSLNNVFVPDDNDSSKNFFEYSVDSTVNLLTPSEARRSFTLDEPTDYFDFLVDDPDRGTTTLYNPVNAYNAGEIFNNKNLVFVGINQGNYLSVKLRPDPAPSKPILSAGQLLLFHSPIYLRDPNLLTDTDFHTDAYMKKSSRNFSFLGHWKTGAIFEKNTFNGKFDFSHPLISGLTVDSIDTYFRHLPPSLAGGTFTAVTPVTAYRLTVRKVTGDPTGKLRNIHIMKWAPGQYNFPANSTALNPPMTTVLFDRIRGVKFIREHVSSPIINIEVMQ